MDDSFKDFCVILLQEFGEEYLNRCPTNEEIKQTLQVNSNRGFPVLFALWYCKHFPWDMCPMAKVGQHKGKEKNTLILEAICFDAFSVSGAPSSPVEFATLPRFRART